jgi:hypothetical protein
MKATTLLFGAAAMAVAALVLASASVARTSDPGHVLLAQATPPASPQPPTSAPSMPATPPPSTTTPTAPSTPPVGQAAPTPPATQPSAPPPAASQPAPSPSAPATGAPPAKLTGVAAWATLVGNTVTGKVDGKDYADYYLADGTVKSMDDSQIVTGKWALEGDRICFTYPGDPRECYTLEVMGETATFTDRSGNGLRGQILKGNAKNL